MGKPSQEQRRTQDTTQSWREDQLYGDWGWIVNDSSFIWPSMEMTKMQFDYQFSEIESLIFQSLIIDFQSLTINKSIIDFFIERLFFKHFLGGMPLDPPRHPPHQQQTPPPPPQLKILYEPLDVVSLAKGRKTLPFFNRLPPKPNQSHEKRHQALPEVFKGRAWGQGHGYPHLRLD